jgi:hypothetical protein
MPEEEKLKMRRTVIWRPRKVEEDSLKHPSTFEECRADGVFQS